MIHCFLARDISIPCTVHISADPESFLSKKNWSQEAELRIFELHEGWEKLGDIYGFLKVSLAGPFFMPHCSTSKSFNSNFAPENRPNHPQQKGSMGISKHPLSGAKTVSFRDPQGQCKCGSEAGNRSGLVNN